MTIYTVRVVGADGSVGQGCTVCTTSPCLYVHQVTDVTKNYSIFVTSVNQDGTLGSQNSTTIGELKNPLQHKYADVIQTLFCLVYFSFRFHFYYCMIVKYTSLVVLICHMFSKRY